MEDKIEKRDNQAIIRYLKRYKHIDNHINDLIREKEEWMTRATHITQNLSFAPGGGERRDITAEAINHISEIEVKINHQIDVLTKCRDEIEDLIKQVKHDDYRRVLRLRYIDGMRWEQIALEVGRTYRWVLILHGRALCEIDISKLPANQKK